MTALRGIDVSRWQGAIAWLTVKPQIDFAYIKAGGGDDISPYFDYRGSENAKGARNAGIPFGFYWFYSGRNTVASQLSLIKDFQAGNQGNALPWVIDIEDPSRGAGDIVGGLELAEDVQALTGVAPLIYTGAWWWDPKWALAKSIGAPEPVPYGLWAASYTPGPIIPKGWTDYTVWQHSDKGRIAGIIGDVDLNLARAQFWDTPQEVTMTRGQPRIDYGRVVHVLPSDASAAAMKTVMDAGYGRRETVGFSYDDAGVGDLSSRRAVLWDIPVADRPGFVAFFAQFYPGVVVEFKTTGAVVIDPPPPPAATGKMRLGVNVITGDAGVMNRALAAGCTAISGINMFGQLADMAAQRPDVTFMARRYVNSMPPPDPDVVFEGAQSPHVWYLTPLNECDVQCNGTPQQIRERAAFDKTMFERMQAKGRRYCGFGFSVGTAEYTNPDVVAAMREVYAPLYARGMGFNGHFYRPWRTHNPDEWYEGRWRFLFGTGPMECGFDPNPNLAGIFSDEVGLDEGSLGGFNAAGWSPERVEVWCREFMSYSQSQPYGGLFRAAVIFQAGNKSTAPNGWAGYDVDTPDMLAAIGRAAQAPIAPWVTPRAMPTPDAADGVPRQLMTGRKVIAQWESQP